ncbi:MAG: thermonuclease family protein [Planctomycetota bacterium]|nr:thermonuclease family protein [Planctomycetota bacterium]MCZ6699168.1 thermonuclease family protein [Planctomycetota bacterium]
MSLRRVCALIAVVDSDTLKVTWEGQERLVRLMDVDPERSALGGGKPATEFGRLTLRWARQTVYADVDSVELQFPTDKLEYSNSGMLLCYVDVRGDNYNVRLVREGWSPCFEKYGRPRLHREAMEKAELWARVEGRGIWGGRGGRGDYGALKDYWRIRAGQIDDYRQAIALGEDILDSRLQYDEIVNRARNGTDGQVFAELARSYHQDDGAVSIQLGGPRQPLDAYFPKSARALALFLEREYVGFGKPNYLFFNGRLSINGENPQIVIDRLDQVRTFPTRT